MNERKTTIQIYYYIPDYSNILQEFIWQCVDYQPEFPRTHQFLEYWHKNIEAKIHTIYLSQCDFWGNYQYKNITQEFKI